MTDQPEPARLRSPFGEFELERRPPTPNQPLQAWDATDEYLLDELARIEPTHGSARTLVINDAFGALALALRESMPCSWGDSCTAHLALAENFVRNAQINTATPIPATLPPAPIGALPYRIVMWRIPKTLALFRQQAAQLQATLAADTLVLAGGMIKHLPEQTVEVLGGLGRVDILHARKKARLFRVTPQPSLPPIAAEANQPLRIDDLQLELAADANVFARDKFDIGARFFIEQFRHLPRAQHIADLGCGNGVLGIVAQRLQPDARIVFCDESYQAVASAAHNYRRNIGDEGVAQFHCDDGLSHYAGLPFDLIVCNPPFHQNHATGDQIAWRMFSQSRQHLRSGGELWIVGNRHLDYHVKLKRLFGNCRQVAGNPKFVVLAARK
jgi:16S rRNA (guanine1207-N2)-methyltransferase